MKRRIGIVGARGHVGSELIHLLAGHNQFELAFVSSREREGQRLDAFEPGIRSDLRYVNFDADTAAAQNVDALVLALPNGAASSFVAALDTRASDTVVLDLSADYRFADDWYYGLPELTRARASGQRRISNPGCYATAMQLAIAPVRGWLRGPVQCFGVSGYSGAGTAASDKNDPEKLRNNLMPYALIGHVHEREVTHQLGLAIEFMPQVAPHFRGITLTANLHLAEPTTTDALRCHYAEYYAAEPLVSLCDDAPWVSRIAGRHGVEIGGITVSGDGLRAVVVATLDNLLKGAATQALQNLNLAFGFAELDGIALSENTHG